MIGKWSGENQAVQAKWCKKKLNGRRDEAGNYEKPDMFWSGEPWKEACPEADLARKKKKKRKALWHSKKFWLTPKKPLDSEGEMKSDLHYEGNLGNDLHDGRNVRVSQVAQW